MKWIALRYKCACMQDEKVIHVPARRKREDVIKFMERTKLLVSVDHELVNALCTRTHLEYLRIPFQDGTRIGETEGGES